MGTQPKINLPLVFFWSLFLCLLTSAVAYTSELSLYNYSVTLIQSDTDPVLRLSWETSAPARHSVAYGLDPQEMEETPITAQPRTVASVHLRNLMPRSVYWCEMRSVDAAGVVNKGPLLQCSTRPRLNSPPASPTPDTLSPRVYNVRSYIQQSSAERFLWMFDVDEAVTGVLLVGTSPEALTKRVLPVSAKRFLGHMHFEVVGLAAGTPYYFQATVTDRSGNTTMMPVLRMRTRP